MNDVSQITQVAKGISDYGMMAITAALFLLLSAAMMVASSVGSRASSNR